MQSQMRIHKKVLWVIPMITALILGWLMSACTSSVGAPALIPDQANRPVSLLADKDEGSDKDARLYRMFFDVSGKEDSYVIRDFNGHLHLANYEEIFGEVKSLPEDKYGNRVSGWKLVDGLLWSIVANPMTGAVSILTVDADGTQSSAIDLNGDRVAEIVEVRLGSDKRFSFMTEELGREVFELWLLGKNPLCDPALLPNSSIPAFGCPEDGSGGGDGGSAPADGQLYDPIDALCGEYASSGARPSAPVMAHGGHGYGSHRHRHASLPTRGDHRNGELIVTTIYHDSEGNHVSTYKEITFFDENGQMERRVNERVDHEGQGTRTITDYGADGTTKTQTETFETHVYEETDEIESGEYDPSESEPPTQRPDGSVIDPGPDGASDPDVIADWCAEYYSPHLSGVEQAVATDPSAFQLNCDDIVTQSSDEKCVVIAWAGSDDFNGALHTPSAGTGCGNLEQPGPDDTCSGSSIEVQMRGMAARMSSVQLSNIEICPPIVCNPTP